jgi:hypothetical protein
MIFHTPVLKKGFYVKILLTGVDRISRFHHALCNGIF